MIFKWTMHLYNLKKLVSPYIFYTRKHESRIKHIDFIKNEVKIFISGVKVPIILRYSEILEDNWIFSQLSPKHAALIGHHHGMYIYNYQNKSNYPNVPLNCFESNITGAYTLLSLDRDANITYLDRVRGVQNIMSPHQMILNKNVINKFPPLQACYIGILSGIARAKIENKYTCTNRVC